MSEAERLAEDLRRQYMNDDTNFDTMIEASIELRRLSAELAAVEQELEALKRAISEAEPVAWMVMNGVCNYQLCGSKKSADHLRDDLQKRHDLSGSLAAMSIKPLYTLKGIK